MKKIIGIITVLIIVVGVAFVDKEAMTESQTLEIEVPKFLAVNIEVVKSPIEYINYKDVFRLEDEEYLVLFTDEKCEFCVELWDNHVKGYKDRGTVPLYVVDLSEGNNGTAWDEYDLVGVPMIMEFGETKTEHVGLKVAGALLDSLMH